MVWRTNLAGKNCGKLGGNHIHFDKAPLIADNTLKPTFCLPQSKPLIPLQKEEDPETHKTVLTNYMFPQQIRTEDCEYCAFNETKCLFSFQGSSGTSHCNLTANVSDLFSPISSYLQGWILTI